MANPDRQLTWFLRLFLAIGVVLLIVGVAIGVRTAQFVAEAERATGNVIDLSQRRDSEGGVVFYPVVVFTTADGQVVEFVAPVGSSPPSVQPGDLVEVLYDSDNPYRAELGGFLDLWLFPGVFVVIGGIFVGSALFVRQRTRDLSDADTEWLRRHGRYVRGGSPRVIHDESIDILGRSPFRVDVDVYDPDHNEVRVLSSERVWFDPSPFLADRDAIEVYIDPERPERYLLDLSFLPHSGQEHAT